MEMKQEMVVARSRYLAHKQCPWACRIIQVDNGGDPDPRSRLWECFESAQDYKVWAAQK